MPSLSRWLLSVFPRSWAAGAGWTHDLYSELKYTLQESVGLSVENGLSKIYVGKASSVPYEIGQPVFIYRKHTGDGIKKYKSPHINMPPILLAVFHCSLYREHITTCARQSGSLLQ